MNIEMLASFSVNSKMELSDAQAYVSKMLTKNEDLLLAYTHKRDKVFFTSKRIICLDVQVLTGTKREYRSFPYSKIISYSVETAGTFDKDSDFKIWISGVGVFEIKFGLKLDVSEINVFMGEMIL